MTAPAGESVVIDACRDYYTKWRALTIQGMTDGESYVIPEWEQLAPNQVSLWMEATAAAIQVSAVTARAIASLRLEMLNG